MDRMHKIQYILCVCLVTDQRALRDQMCSFVLTLSAVFRDCVYTERGMPGVAAVAGRGDGMADRRMLNRPWEYEVGDRRGWLL